MERTDARHRSKRSPSLRPMTTSPTFPRPGISTSHRFQDELGTLPQLPAHNGRQQIVCQMLQTLAHCRIEVVPVAGLEQRRMLAGDFARWPAIAEGIECKRLASHTLRALQWIGMTVIREVCRSEPHHAVEQRQNLGLAPRHIAAPQLKVAAILFAPVLVEV